MIAALWNRFYQPGTTGSFHGDMAAAFDAIAKSNELSLGEARKLRTAISIHMQIERSAKHVGRKWFCEKFGNPDERIV